MSADRATASNAHAWRADRGTMRLHGQHSIMKNAIADQ